MTRLDQNQQRGLCEYLDQEFHAKIDEAIPSTREFRPEPVHDGKPLEEASRVWLGVKWSGMKYWQDPNSEDHGWIGQIVGQRSDGQLFYVVMSWRPDDEESDDDPMQRLRRKFLNATISFNSYRDCSCGIIGHRETGEVDYDGDPIEEVIHSPCRFHPRLSADQLEDMFNKESQE